MRADLTTGERKHRLTMAIVDGERSAAIARWASS